VRAGRGVLAVAGAVDPEALAARPRPGNSPAPPRARRRASTIRRRRVPDRRRGTRRRTPRQVNQTGGWSGSSAMVSIGSGGGSSRDGRGQSPGQPAPVSGAIGATRDRAFGHVALHRGEAIEPVLADTVGEDVDQHRRCRVPAPRPARRWSACPQRLGNGRGSVISSMPKPGSIVSILSVRSRVRRLASRTGWAVPTRMPRCGCRRGEQKVEPRAPSPRAPRARRKAPDQLAGIAGDRLGRADRLGEIARAPRRFPPADRLDRFARRPNAWSRRRPSSGQAQASGARGVPARSPIVSKPSRTQALDDVSAGAQGRDRQVTHGRAVPPDGITIGCRPPKRAKAAWAAPQLSATAARAVDACSRKPLHQARRASPPRRHADDRRRSCR
jgi:hypothetical protein